jgi:hypothetical protein
VQFSTTKKGAGAALSPDSSEILLCRVSAEKIATDSGKKLLKNNIIFKKNVRMKCENEM